MATFTSQHSGRWTDPATWVINKTTYPEAFGSWVQDGAIASDNVIDNPYRVGSLNADKLYETLQNTVHRRKLAITLTANTCLTFVCWFKKAELNFGLIQLLNKDNVFMRVWYDLNNGTVGTIDSGVTSTSISNEGNGWYRCEAVFPCGTGATTTYSYIGISSTDGVDTYQGDGSSGIYAWGATTWEGGVIVPTDDRDFNSDTGYWTKATGVTISGGECVFNNVAGLSGISRNASIISGLYYTATFRVVSCSAGGFRPSIGGTVGTTRLTPGTYTETLLSASTNFSCIS